MTSTTTTDDDHLDSVIGAARPVTALSVKAEAEANRLARAAFRPSVRRRKLIIGAAITGALAIGGSAVAVAAPYLSPLAGYTQLASFSYGVAEGAPGITCTTVIAYHATPDDPHYDAGIVTRFATFMRAYSWKIPVPEAARTPYAGSAAETYAAPGTQALNKSYQSVVSAALMEFAATDPGESRFNNLDSGDPLSHSLELQDSAVCTGHE